jgi:hypothetical protein
VSLQTLFSKKEDTEHRLIAGEREREVRERQREKEVRDRQRDRERDSDLQ